MGAGMACNHRELGTAAQPLEVYAHRVILASGSEYFKGKPIPMAKSTAPHLSRTSGRTQR
jgi:hypothetical protein